MILPKSLKLIPPPKEAKPLALLKRKIRAEETMYNAKIILQWEVRRAKSHGVTREDLFKVPAVLVAKENYIQAELDLQAIKEEILLGGHPNVSILTDVPHEAWLRSALDSIRRN